VSRAYPPINGRNGPVPVPGHLQPPRPARLTAFGQERREPGDAALTRVAVAAESDQQCLAADGLDSPLPGINKASALYQPDRHTGLLAAGACLRRQEA
jgi:hypothetical protein